MRIDQYLWCIRIFKSRNIANNACRKGYVYINDIKVKPSREVSIMDIIKIKKNQIFKTLKVTEIPLNRVGAKFSNIYYIETTPSSILKQDELERLASRITRDEGSGRPTKKERREIDDFFFDDILED